MSKPEILASERPSQTSLKPDRGRSGPRISEMPLGVNSLDHSIYCHNGSTSALEMTSHRLQSAKFEPIPSLTIRIEQLTREMGCLRQEIHFYRQCFEVLQRLRQNSYDVYQQLFLESYFPPTTDRIQELAVQLHHALEDSMRREAKAEKEWKAFWGFVSKAEELKGGLI